jgi:LysR family transcriptional regulator, glycine cleavage system transcriptional activator
MYPATSPPPLPSLHSLLVFEAAARHASFTRAARELAVTQAAVSHQIKQLEVELGTALFRRWPRRIELTPAGRAWAAELHGIFSRLQAVNQKLRRSVRSERPVVAVSIIPSFGSRWLVPRLGRFLDRHADVDVRISASEQLVDFALDAIDVGIRYGRGHYPGLFAERLADDFFVVVCSPALLAKKKLRSPRDLEKETLLHDDYPDGWSRWLEINHGGSELARTRRTELTDSSMIVEAALRGQGVALARWSLAVDELAAGRLVRPFPRAARLPTGLAYYFVTPRENLRRREISDFRDWIRKEARVLRKPE